MTIAAGELFDVAEELLLGRGVTARSGAVLEAVEERVRLPDGSRCERL